MPSRTVEVQAMIRGYNTLTERAMTPEESAALSALQTLSAQVPLSVEHQRQLARLRQGCIDIPSRAKLVESLNTEAVYQNRFRFRLVNNRIMVEVVP